MSESKFGEPWEADDEVLLTNDGWFIGEAVGVGSTPDEDIERASRIAQCVNACSGIENVAAIPNLVQTVRDFVAKCPAFAECAELDAALAALESKGGGE